MRGRLQVGEARTGHHFGGDGRDGRACRFGDEWHGARCARVGLQHIDVLTLDGELHIDEAADLQRVGERRGFLLQALDHVGAERVRGQGAGGIAGVHARFLNMLHHAGDVHLFAVRDLGIQSSGSRYVSFLDGDDTFCPNRFVCVEGILEADSAVDAVYGDTTVVVEDVSQETSWEDGQYFGVGDPCTGATLLSRLIQSHPWATSAITARRCLLEKTGLFSDKLSVAEDCHLWMRMAAIGNIVHTGFRDPVSVYHRQAESLYRAGVENKSHYSTALQLFYRWLKRRTVRQEISITAKQEITAWIDNSLIQLRSEKRVGMLVRLLTGWIAVAPELTLHRRNASHAIRALLGR